MRRKESAATAALGDDTARLRHAVEEAGIPGFAHGAEFRVELRRGTPRTGGSARRAALGGTRSSDGRRPRAGRRPAHAEGGRGHRSSEPADAAGAPALPGGRQDRVLVASGRRRARRIRRPGVARARWPIRSSKPAGRGSPTVGRFDSCAAPLTNHLQIPRFGTASLSILSVSPERLRVRRVRGVATGRPPGGESVCPRQDWRGCTLERCCRLPRPWASPGRNRTRPSIAGTVSVRQRQVHGQALRGRVARCVSIAASTSWRRRAGASAPARAGRG